MSRIARILAHTHLPVVEFRTEVDAGVDVLVRLPVGSLAPDHEEVGHERRAVSHVLYRLSVHYAEVVRSWNDTVDVTLEEWFW